ncbi:hypothetical protein ES705_32744 [subsurface metagenome]
MRVLIKIAFRNLREHKAKTLIIGIIITMGISILIMGNSMMDTATVGIKRAYWSNYTGHIILSAATDEQLTLFGRQDMTSMNDPIPRIPEYASIFEYCSSHPEIESVNPQTASRALMSAEEIEGREMVLLFGIDADLYRNMFPENLDLLVGNILKPGEEGILLSETVKSQFEETTGRSLQPGDKILLTGINSGSGMKIRELTVRGIFRFKQSNPQLDRVSLVDINNLRILEGMTMTPEAEIELDEMEQSLLGDFSEKDLFADTPGHGSETLLVEEVASTGKDLSPESMSGLFGSLEERKQFSQTDSGAWHFLLIKLKDPGHIAGVTADINSFLSGREIDAEVSDWLSFAGMGAEMAYSIKNVFNILILIIAVVAVIIIMNTLVISVTERIPEIGTMRAIGAQKSFVRRMILMETAMISGVFGLIGILLGAGVLGILYLSGIRAPNFFFEVIFGGKVLHPVLSLQALGISLVVVFIVAIAASLYPASIALKVKPVTAMQSV